MFHFCIMGGHGGELTAGQKVCVVVFGGCEFRLPTLAKQILENRRRAQHGLPKRTHLFITICGGTQLKSPTLAEEFMAMREAINSGVLTMEDWDAAVVELAAEEGLRYASVTLMGGFDASELPEENEEVDGLAINRHLGHIPDEAGTTLELGVGQRGAQRVAIVRRALATAVGARA